MIEILAQSTAACLVVHFGGKVTGSKYQQILDTLGERLKAGEKVSIVVLLSGLEFFDDLSAFRKDIEFSFGEYKHIHQAAFIGDQKWIEWFTRLISPFTKTEEKYFPESEIEAAYQWASV
jgi:hypothetical protein